MNREPVVLAFVAATLGLLVAFHAPISDVQVKEIIGWAGCAFPLVGMLWARSKVTPVTKDPS